jgi:hypothetical protein
MTRQKNSAFVIWGIAVLLALLVLAGGLANLGTLPGSSLPPGVRTAGVILFGLLAAGLSIFAISGAVHLFSRWFPVAHAYELTYTQADWGDFRRLSRLSAVVYLSIAVPLTLLLRLALLLLARGYAGLLPAKLVIQVSPDFWTIPAIFSGLFLALIFTYLLYRWRMKNRFPRYLAFHNQRFGFDQRKAGQVVVAFGLLFSLGLVIIGLNLYVRVSPEGLVINRFFGLVEERYTYTDVTHIEEQASGSAASSDQPTQRSFVIQFQDGRQWRSSTYRARLVPPSTLAALHYIAQQSGIHLKKITANQR